MHFSIIVGSASLDFTCGASGLLFFFFFLSTYEGCGTGSRICMGTNAFSHSWIQLRKAVCLTFHWSLSWHTVNDSSIIWQSNFSGIVSCVWWWWEHKLDFSDTHKILNIQSGSQHYWMERLNISVWAPISLFFQQKQLQLLYLHSNAPLSFWVASKIEEGEKQRGKKTRYTTLFLNM